MKYKKLECQELVICSPDGKNKVSIVCKNDVFGLWLTKENSEVYMGLVFDEAGPYVAISRTSDSVPQLVISVDDLGEAFFQVAPNGEDSLNHLYIDINKENKNGEG